MTTAMSATDFENHKQWSDVKAVCARLRKAGFQALLAGGCVRDLLMGREPNDFDVATDATPDQIEALFDRAIAVGKAFGVIILPFDDFQIEVATFREDLEYKDGRRPEGVKFSNAKADAQRRDFTVNALFLDPETNEVVDYVAGRKDIAAKILRTVGSPNLRFDEDKLRILRALRFAAQLDFQIEPKTLAAIRERASEVSVVSRERIRDELLKLLKTPRRSKGLELLIETNVIDGAFPEIAPSVRENENAWLEAFSRLESESDPTALLALFLWPAYADEKDFRHRVLKSLRLDNALVDTLVAIFKNLPTVLSPSDVRAGELAYLLTRPYAPTLLLVADTLARANARPHELDDRTKWNTALRAARPDGHTPTEPLVAGKDLLSWGVKPGPKVGELLHEIFLLQLEGRLGTRADIENWVRAQKNQ